MKQLRLQLNRMNAMQIAFFLLILGLFLGVLCANVFRDNFAERIRIYEENVFSVIAANNINYAGLFRYVLSNNLNSFLVFWLLSITILGIPYMAFKVCSFGFFAGFFVSAVTMQYGLKGILLVLVYVFPHGLLYLPIALLSLYRGFQMCRDIYQQTNTGILGFLKPLRSNLLLILILAVALVFASFLEAYPGAFILKKALGLF